MNILHIDSSILGGHSVSRTVSAAAVERLRRDHPAAAVIRRDLADDAPAHLTLAHLPATHPAAAGVSETADVLAKRAEGRAILDEFLAADAVVIGAPMYNFGLPSQLKAWLDRILIAGETFRYGPEGPVGLAGGKQVIVALSRGNFYGSGAPAAGFEHAEAHLRAMLALIGVDPEVIVAEGVSVSPDHRQAALEGALAKAREPVRAQAA